MYNKSSQQGKVAVVTGSSSGIGFETSLLLARKGFYTYATMRNLNKSQKIKEIAEKENLPLKVLKLDLTDEKSVKDAFRQKKHETSRIDVLVNNAGFDIMGAVEDLSFDDYKSQFETNFFGVIRVTKEVIPIMRNQGNSGNIINVSSVGGKIGLPLNSAYISSKFALEGLSESMRYELEQFGIDVILIEPGVVKTNFFENVVINNNNTSTNNKTSYSQLTQKLFEGFVPMLNSSSSSVSSDVAEVIYQAIESNNRDVRYPVGKDAVSIIKTRQKLSDKEFEKWIKESIFQQKGFIH